jgi:hypothetical protein
MSNTTINTITVTMLFIIVVGCILGLSFQQHLLCEAKIALVQEQLLAMQKQNADLQNQVGHLTRVISKTNIAVKEFSLLNLGAITVVMATMVLNVFLQNLPG